MPISPTGQFKLSLDSFYVTESPLSVTNIEEMAMFYVKLTSLEDFPLEDAPISPTVQFKQSLDSFYVTDSPLSVTNIAMFYIKLTSLDDFPLEDGPISPTGQFKQSFESFYVTDSPLCVTNSTNGNVLFKLTSVNDDLTVYMLQIVLYVLLT